MTLNPDLPPTLPTATKESGETVKDRVASAKLLHVGCVCLATTHLGRYGRE